jgi:DnaA family protein
VSVKQLALDIAAPPAPALDNFVPGRNAELVVALYAVANGASDERFIYLWGAPGSGRSHLLHAVARAARQHGRNALPFAPDIAVDDIENDALVTADDVHLLNAGAQIALFNLHNRLRAGRGVLIASGNAAPAQLELRADLATRLGSGLVYRVHELNDEEKGAALRRQAEMRGFSLSQEVARYLLRHARRDMPALLATLDALDRYSLETKRGVTVPLLRELLPALSHPPAQEEPANGAAAWHEDEGSEK